MALGWGPLEEQALRAVLRGELPCETGVMGTLARGAERVSAPWDHGGCAVLVLRLAEERVGEAKSPSGSPLQWDGPRWHGRRAAPLFFARAARSRADLAHPPIAQSGVARAPRQGVRASPEDGAPLEAATLAESIVLRSLQDAAWASKEFGLLRQIEQQVKEVAFRSLE